MELRTWFVYLEWGMGLFFFVFLLSRRFLFFQFFGILGSSGPLVPWSSGPLVPSSSGPLFLWSPGPLVLWSAGPPVLRSSGPPVPLLGAFSCYSVEVFFPGLGVRGPY